jgi:hypothetical protein
MLDTNIISDAIRIPAGQSTRDNVPLMAEHALPPRPDLTPGDEQ